MSLFDENDVADFRASRLAVVQGTYFSTAVFSDAFLLQQIQAAEQDIQIQLKVPFEPTHIFPFMPTQDQITALNNKPWLDEPGYDYDADFFRGEKWGYMVTRHIPIISVTSIKLAYPNPQNAIYTIPNDWMRIDRKYGHIRLVPASSQFIAPLGAFLMQALGGGSSIPSMIQVEYDAGLEDAKTKWPQLIDVILKKAVLKIMQGVYVPGSKSSSADGMSQSLSFKIQDYEDQIQFALFGPKGTNGGLWTALHGVQSAFIGMVA